MFNQTKFQIRYLKSFLKHISFVLRENKTIRHVHTRLATQFNNVYKDSCKNKIEQVNASRMLAEIDAEIQSLYKPFDIDERFDRPKNYLYEKFPHWVRYHSAGRDRIHHIVRDEMVTAAHILYNKLRNKKHHLNDESKEHEYIHALTYWTERLAYLTQEECTRCIVPRESVIEVGVGTECGHSAQAGKCGGSSHE